MAKTAERDLKIHILSVNPHALVAYCGTKVTRRTRRAGSDWRIIVRASSASLFCATCLEMARSNEGSR